MPPRPPTSACSITWRRKFSWALRRRPSAPTAAGTEWFDGRFAAEVRLWDAIEGAQLCPFQYFGVHDDVDLSALEWKRAVTTLPPLRGLHR